MLSDQRIMNPLNAYRCSVAYITSRRKEEVVEQRMAKGSWNDAAFSLPCYQIDVSRAGQNQLPLYPSAVHSYKCLNTADPWWVLTGIFTGCASQFSETTLYAM